MPKDTTKKYVLTQPKMKTMMRKKVENSTFGLDEVMMKGFHTDVSFNFVGHLGPHVLGDRPHTHNVDEILFFISTDPDKPDLGAEVEIGLGEEWEKHLINTPAIICVPKGMWHCPVYVKSVERPFFFGHLLLQSSYGLNLPKRK